MKGNFVTNQVMSHTLPYTLKDTVVAIHRLLRHATFLQMPCSMCVFDLNVFCLSFINEVKVLNDLLLYVQLKRR